jgi:hypothetical protein
MRRSFRFRRARPGVLTLCLLLSGCGLKAALFLREPAVAFPPLATTHLAPASATLVAPGPATLSPAAGTAALPAAATSVTTPFAATLSAPPRKP